MHGRQVSVKDNDMKKKHSEPDMLDEYDFRGGERGKYAKRYAEGTNVVVLDPDVARHFPDSNSVNELLRSIVAIMERRSRPAPPQ